MTKTKVKSAKYFEPGEIEPNFNAIYFENQGTTIVRLNGKTIVPGDNFSDNGFTNELNTTLYRFTFEGVGVNNLFVMVKRFME
jgi:hypothetical protein